MTPLEETQAELWALREASQLWLQQRDEAQKEAEATNTALDRERQRRKEAEAVCDALRAQVARLTRALEKTLALEGVHVEGTREMLQKVNAAWFAARAALAPVQPQSPIIGCAEGGVPGGTFVSVSAGTRHTGDAPESVVQGGEEKP